MKKYLLKSIPKTEIELPEKPLELVAEELQGVSEYINSDVYGYIQDSRGSYQVQYHTKDSDGNPIIQKAIKRGEDIARKLVTDYSIERFNNATREGVIDEEIADTEKDPFDFMTQHSVFDVYQRIFFFKQPELFAKVFNVFQEGLDYYQDGVTVALALAYSEKKGDAVEALDEFFSKQILSREPSYSFLLNSLIYFSTDAKDKEIVH
jgi:hypothetical protein